MQHYIKTTSLSAILLFIFFNLFGQGGYVIESNYTTIDVSKKGMLSITEILDVNFTEKRHGIYRSIPYKYRVEGKDINLSIRDISVDNKYKVTKQKGEKLIRIGSPNKYVYGKQKYIIKYDVEGAISDYSDHQEFFWNIVGFKSESLTLRSSFKVTFPIAWADSLYDYRAFTGAKGSRDHDLVLHKDGSTIIGAHRSSLPPNHGISLGVKIPSGLLPLASSYASNSSEDTSKSLEWIFTWWNLIPIGIATFLLGLWRRFEKADNIDTPIKDQYYPPEGMSPAEVGTFYDHKINRRDIISLLPHWGNQGLITIKPIEGLENDMYFSKLKHPPSDMKDYELHLFKGLFEDNDVVLLSDLKDQFYKTMRKTSTLIKEEVCDQELYDISSKKIFHSGWMIGLGITSILMGIFIMIQAGAFVAGVGLILIGIFLFVFHFKPPKLSEKGRLIKTHLKGLHQHLKDPHPDRMNEIIKDDPDYLHHIFPFVLAFDLDQSWTSFQKDHTFSYGPPIWYAGSMYSNNNSFNYRKISESFDVRNIEKIFYSTPVPSSNSGGSFSGGGFSGGSAGGGFGGGSTGSW